MSHSSYCHRDLPGLETLCQQCFEAGYDHVVHPKSWRQRFQLRPRFTQDNFIGFLIFFLFFFVMFRFDFPYCHVRHMWTARSSGLFSALMACVAFFYEGRERLPSSATPSGSIGREIYWRRLSVMVAAEVAVGLMFYGLFTFLPLAVEVIFALIAGVIIQYDIIFPNPKKSLGSLLGMITAVPGTACLIAWSVTDRDIWLRLMVVGLSLSATLIVLDRREDFQ